MLKKSLSIAFILIIFFISVIFINPTGQMHKVLYAQLPTKIFLEDREISVSDLDCFDTYFSDKNKRIADKLSISEEEAFVLGNLGKYWANNLLKGRKVYIDKHGELIYHKFSYRIKFMYSGFCIKDDKPCYPEGFEKKIKEVRRGNYKVINPESDVVYSLSDKRIRSLKNYLVIRKSHLPKYRVAQEYVPTYENIIDKGNIKIFFSDLTSKIKPDRNCSSDICKEILKNINNSSQSIDIAVYGYSSVPAIENAIKSAMNRGVKIRLVYDLNEKGENIYPDTPTLTHLLSDNMSDKNSSEASNIMHNKFYIFDDKILITGSANLSHTDMSGFNSNSIVVINSPEAAKIYKREFEQMYGGNFHNAKKILPKSKISFDDTELTIYFSPKDKAISNAVLPLINKAERYIYIPIFILTDRRITEALINAKKRGVDVRVIIDALNASVRHSKHNELRAGGISVKTENYAGKMHSKSLVVDDMYTVIGSMNFSFTGENKNDENLVLIKDSTIAKEYKNFFIYQWNRIDNKWLYKNAGAESLESIGSCSDEIDNNYNGLKDAEEPACREK